MSEQKTVTLPSNQQEIVLPELSTEQVLQLVRLAKNVITRVPDILSLVDEARLDYLRDEARGYTTKTYLDGLEEEERQAITDKLTADFQEWYLYEDLSSDEREALAGIGITEESFKESGNEIQFSFPSEVPQLALIAKVFPEIYDSCSDEIIMAVCVTLMPAKRLAKAVQTNTVEAQLRDYRADLTQKMKPGDFIHLAAEIVAYVLHELRGLGGPLGEVLATIKGELAAVGSAPSPENETNEPSSEKSEPESSSDLVELPTD